MDVLGSSMGSRGNIPVYGTPTICLVVAQVTGLWNEVPGRAETLVSPVLVTGPVYSIVYYQMSNCIKYNWGEKLYCLCLFLCIYIYRLMKL